VSWLSDVRYWFLYRFHPRHRYHVLRLGSPGYSDPTHLMIFAVMGIVERYIEELRWWCHWGEPDRKHLTHREIIDEIVRWREEPCKEEWDEESRKVELAYYKRIQALVAWWDQVKNMEDLDDAWNDDGPDDAAPWSGENVNKMLREAIELRGGMWT
jgi:hypothetical protein